MGQWAFLDGHLAASRTGRAESGNSGAVLRSRSISMTRSEMPLPAFAASRRRCARRARGNPGPRL